MRCRLDVGEQKQHECAGGVQGRLHEVEGQVHPSVDQVRTAASSVIRQEK